MMHPIMLLGLALGAGLAYSKRSSSSKPTVQADSGLIDASEKAHPNAELARKAILNALSVKSLTLYEMTAVAIETQLRMPRTAANLRAYAQMAKQVGDTIAGDDDDEVGGSEGYGDDDVAGDDDDEVGGSEGYGDDDEVGARKRRVSSLFKKVTAATRKAKRRKRKPAAAAAAPAPAVKRKRRKKRARAVAPALAAAVAAPSVANVLAAANATPSSAVVPYGAAAPRVDWDSAEDDEDGDGDDEGGADEGDDDEVGASSRRPNKLPEWLRFSATQSMLAGDPKLIKATAQVMRRMGYHEHAEVHLRALSAHR